jgi:hypothetical protein
MCPSRKGGGGAKPESEILKSKCEKQDFRKKYLDHAELKTVNKKIASFL